MDNKIINYENELELINIFKKLIRIDTTNPPGNELAAIKSIKKILDMEKINSQIIMSSENRGNLIAEIKGKKTNKKPIILLSHIDVVKASKSWKFPAFKAHEENGYIYGRGALDTKNLTATEIMIMILISRNNIELDRDIILIVSADEENGSKYGMDFIRKNYPSFIKDGIVISEGGGFIIENKDEVFRIITAGEKGSCTIKFETYGKSGHPSSPPKEQALLIMNEVISRILDFELKNKSTSAAKFFKKIIGEDIDNKTVKDLYEYINNNSVTVKKLDVGKSINVIQKKVECEVEIRFLPVFTKKEISNKIEEILKGLNVNWEIINFEEGYQSDFNNKFIKILEKNSIKYGEKAKLVPIIALGRTDGRFMKGSIYGFTPVLSDLPFEEVLKKVHNIDECISIESLKFGLKVLYESILEINNYKG